MLILQPGNLYAKIYKWVDQDGNVKYSNVAPPSSAQEVETTKEISEPQVDGAVRITDEQIENAKRNLDSARTFPIHLSGNIVDSNSRPVSNVKMIVKEVRSIRGTFEENHTEREKKIDGAFEVQCQDCSNVSLYFLADGFYPKSVNFQLTDEEMNTFIYGKEDDGFSFVRQGLIIKLERNSNPVILGRVNAVLDLNREGFSRVLTFEAGKPHISSKQEVIKKRELSGSNVPSMISLEAPVTMIDEIVRILQNYPPDSTLPTNIYIDFSGPQTGVFPVETSEPDWPKKAYRELKEAPEEGYSNRLSINFDPKYNKKQYFYCQFGNFFGKGQISSLGSGYDRNSDRTLAVHIEIYFNRDGNRNLDSLDH